MHRLLHLRQFSKEGKGKSKKKNTHAVSNPDPGPIEAPPLTTRVVAPPTTPPAASPSTVPIAPLSEPEPSSAVVSPALAVPATPAPALASPGLETSGPLPPLPPPSPKATPPAEGVFSPALTTDTEVRPTPPLPPRPSPPNDSPTKPLSMRSLASADTQASLTSLATATDRSYATPERAPLSNSQNAGQAWTSDAPHLSPTQAGEASIGALALLPDDEQATPIPPVVETDHVVSMEGSAQSNEPRSASPSWTGWPTEPLLPCPRSQSDAQDLLENLGLDELDGSAPPSASSMYSEVSVERIESTTEAQATVWVPITIPSPEMRDVAHGALNEPHAEAGRSSGELSPPGDAEAPDGSRMSPLEPLLLRAPPAHAVPSSESEPDSASTSAPPLWMQRTRGRAVSAEPDPSPAIAQDGARLPTSPAPVLSDDDPLPSRPSEDDMMRGARTPLRTSKSSSLLTAMSNQAHRIRRNVREAGLLLGDDEAADDDSARGKGTLVSQRSESTDVSIVSPKSAGDLPALQKEAAPKSERTGPMYRTRRNKSQPTLRIADDLEFLHALEQVRLQHKERLELRQRARSARKASMPNLRPPPASRRPPLPMSRVSSDRGAGESHPPCRPRASSAADESLVAHVSGALDVSLTTPDVSTSFLELESLVSDDSASSDASGHDEVSTYASSGESEVISNELGIGHTTGNLPSAPFTNDDDWKKEVKALFLIRELVQTERSYAAHLESLLIVVLKWTGTSSTTRLPTNVLMPTQSTSTSQPLRMPTPTPTTPTHLVTLRQMLPKLISVSRTLVYSIEESPTSEGVARSFLSMLERLEEVHVSWHGVVGSTLRSLRAAESSKSKVKGRLGRVPIAPPPEPPRRPARNGSSSHDLAEPERRDKSRSEPKELSAVDVAIMPTQRIPRYVLLLRDLLSYTSADTEAYATLEAALRAVQELGHRCDQASAPT